MKIQHFKRRFLEPLLIGTMAGLLANLLPPLFLFTYHFLVG